MDEYSNTALGSCIDSYKKDDVPADALIVIVTNGDLERPTCAGEGQR